MSQPCRLDFGSIEGGEKRRKNVDFVKRIRQVQRGLDKVIERRSNVREGGEEFDFVRFSGTDIVAVRVAGALSY